MEGSGDEATAKRGYENLIEVLNKKNWVEHDQLRKKYSKLTIGEIREGEGCRRERERVLFLQ